MQRRAVVRHRRKLKLLARACGAAVVAPGHPLSVAPGDDVLPAVRYLVDATASPELPARTFYQRTLRMLDMFERLEQRHREGAEPQAA